MKKILLLLVGVLTAVAVQAVPAHPNPVKVQHPDGTYVTIRLHGDEWLNFTTTEDGYSVIKDSRGYYVYANLKEGKLQPTTQVAHDAKLRTVAEKAFLADVKKYQAPAMKAERTVEKQKVQQIQRRALVSRRATDYNHFRGLVILVQFKDKTFSRDDYSQIADDMLNMENYTGYDSEVYTGSVRDYFSDNSKGKFKPQFDVVGPVTVNYSQYDGDAKSDYIVWEAVQKADELGVDFSKYDGDGDGVVDLVYFLIAGNGSNYTGNNSGLWWPHRYYFRLANTALDGVYFQDYASSVELYGWLNKPESVKIDGIGTICHEFSHVLGLPDFYDTDYEKSGGESIHPDEWTLMAGGSYNNNARTPAGYSLYERYLVGFTDDIPTINEKKSYTLEPVHASQQGYRINSPVDNEFFLLENRQNDGSYKWDQYLPGHGMLVYRVDRTNLSVWNYNTVNANPAHNYYEILWAGGTDHACTGSDTFPGEGHVTALNNLTAPANLLTHNESENLWGLSDIQEVDGIVTFNVTSGGGAIKPYHVVASNITGSSANITWAGDNDSYRVQYRIAGQNAVVFEDNFESGLDRWTIYTEGEAPYNKGWKLINPSSNLGFGAKSGSNVACALSFNTNKAYDADNWLITPQVTFGKVLKFWVRSHPSWPDKYEVLLSTKGNAVSDFTVTLQPMATAPADNAWNEVVIDLTEYAGQQGYIAIHHKCNDCFYLFIDDFGIYADVVPVGEWQTASATQPNAFLTGLTPARTYEVQVQAATTEGTSKWSEMATFSTNTTKLGDANGDKGVTISDAVGIVNCILGHASSDFNKVAANVNGDFKDNGEPNITITDAVGVVNIILNSGASAPQLDMKETEVVPE